MLTMTSGARVDVRLRTLPGRRTTSTTQRELHNDGPISAGELRQALTREAQQVAARSLCEIEVDAPSVLPGVLARFSTDEERRASGYVLSPQPGAHPKRIACSTAHDWLAALDQIVDRLASPDERLRAEVDDLKRRVRALESNRNSTNANAATEAA
jgi:hypothetical protein